MSQLTCDCCEQSKNQLFPRNSLILPGTKYKMCKTCIEKRLEPRYAIIVAGLSYGHEHVKKIILERRYLGKDISYDEIIKK